MMLLGKSNLNKLHVAYIMMLKYWGPTEARWVRGHCIVTLLSI